MRWSESRSYAALWPGPLTTTWKITLVCAGKFAKLTLQPEQPILTPVMTGDAAGDGADGTDDGGAADGTDGDGADGTDGGGVDAALAGDATSSGTEAARARAN